LLNALKIQKTADVLGFSMGSFVAQELTVTHPEKVIRLVLYEHHVVEKKDTSKSSNCKNDQGSYKYNCK
jgi:pimeloyl-ACP methyl ester carboxylesterase